MTMWCKSGKKFPQPKEHKAGACKVTYSYKRVVKK